VSIVPLYTVDCLLVPCFLFFKLTDIIYFLIYFSFIFSFENRLAPFPGWTTYEANIPGTLVVYVYFVLLLDFMLLRADFFVVYVY